MTAHTAVELEFYEFQTLITNLRPTLGTHKDERMVLFKTTSLDGIKPNTNGSVVTLERSTLEKDLGILIDCELKFSDHMFAATMKANVIMGVIRRTFTHLDLKCFSLLYKSLIRPHLEYGVSVSYTHLTLPTKRIV